MGKKRKQDQWRDDSSSSDVKRRRSCHCQNGETSRTNNGMPWEEFPYIFRDAVIELKDVIQVKVSTDEKFKRKIEKLKEKRRKDKNKHEQDLRILKEDFKILKEDHEELKIKIQEMRKEGCAEVNHYNSSPSQRSQLSQSTRLRLVIESSVSKTIYKKEPVETEDGGGHIKVVMYDGGNPIASDHPLASVRVDLVLIEGWFNEPKRDSWSKEEFEESIIKPRKGITRLVKTGTFDLIDGSCDHVGAIIMDNSQQREVKLGVRIAVHTEIRVLEGVSNPFKVQEGKTKKTATNKKDKKHSPPVPTRNLVHTTSTNGTQHDHGKHTEFPTADTPEDNRLSYTPATVSMMVEGNGQALNGNCQQSCEQIPMRISWLPTSTHSMQHGQNYGLPSTSNQNLMQAAGYSLLDHHLLACGQDQYTGFSNLSADPSFDDVFQRTSTPTELGLPSQSIGEISVDDVPTLNFQTQTHETYGSFGYGQVLLQWDEPHVELKKRWNFLDQLMPLYSTQSGFYRESFPSTSLMDKAHKLLASISSGDSVLKIITSVTSRATQTPQRRGVLIRPIEPYDSDDGPPVKKQMNAKYQLRFFNRVCSDYYTQEQIKSEDGNLLKVALYDENNLVVTSGPLSSASVEVVLLHGDFNAEGHDYWTSEEFSACLVHPHSVKEPPALGGDRVLALTDGEAELRNAYFQTSSFHARTGKYMMGVEIKNVREEIVQEGITSPFLVRVRQGKESSRHRITSLEALLRVRIKFPKQVCDARENVGASSLSSQVRSMLGPSKVEDHDYMVRTASNRPPELSESSCHQIISFKLFGARIELPKQVCGAPECDARENVGASLALHDQSSQVRSMLGESQLSHNMSSTPTMADTGITLGAGLDNNLALPQLSPSSVGHLAFGSIPTSADVGAGRRVMLDLNNAPLIPPAATNANAALNAALNKYRTKLKAKSKKGSEKDIGGAASVRGKRGTRNTREKK